MYGNRSGRRGPEGWRWNITVLSGVHNEAHIGLLPLDAKYRSLGQGCDAVGHEARSSGIVHFLCFKQTTASGNQPYDLGALGMHNQWWRRSLTACIILPRSSCLQRCASIARVAHVSSAACQDREAPPDPMAPIMGPEAVGSISSCFYLGDKSQYRVHVILELLSTSLSCKMLRIVVVKDNGA